MTQHNILVVDDEAPMRKLLSTNLKASAYTVLAAADGTEALKLIEEHPFDLLLLDVNMPGPNGLQVLEAVRRSAEMPILMLSGRVRERDKVEALDLGADDYVGKPFSITELMARVKALLRRVTPGGTRPLALYRFEGLEVDFSARRVRLNGSDVALTRREFEVLVYFARNAGKILLPPGSAGRLGRRVRVTKATTCGRSFNGSGARSRPTGKATLPVDGGRRWLLHATVRRRRPGGVNGSACRAVPGLWAQASAATGRSVMLSRDLEAGP